jgi:hypothetical protein
MNPYDLSECSIARVQQKIEEERREETFRRENRYFWSERSPYDLSAVAAYHRRRKEAGRSYLPKTS